MLARELNPGVLSERDTWTDALSLLVLSPFVLITFGRAAFQMARYNAAGYEDKRLADPVSAGQPQHRVLWLVFDEMDERLAFTNRRPGFRLPELDRFRNESFCATHAYAPSRHTIDSMPALITGKTITSANAVAPDDLLLTFRGGSTGHFQLEKNIFSRAREAGFDTGVAGWYHPYCRVLNESLTDCQWSEFDFPAQNNSKGGRLPEIAVSQTRSLF